MNDNSLNRLGGAGSILAAISYVVVGATFLLDPSAQTSGPEEFWPAFAQNQTAHLLTHWAFALAAIFLIALVPAVSKLVRSANRGWVQWATTLAYIGLAVTTISNLREAGIKPSQATAFAEGDPTIQAAIVEAGRLSSLDPQGWLVFGAVGLWIFVVNWLALRAGTWPKNLAYLGIAGAILYWLVLAGNVGGAFVLNQIAAGLGGVIVGPIWLLWMGLRLRKAAS